MATLTSKIAEASRKVGALKPDKRNQAQNYDYISSDKILERVGDALTEVGVVVFPSITSEETAQVEYTDSYGKNKLRFDAVVFFRMVVADDESERELPWCGRGTDFASPDKALYKAITSGHKYFLMKLLNVGVGNEDGEHETVDEPAPQNRAQPQQRAQDARNGQNKGKTTPANGAQGTSTNGDILFANLPGLQAQFNKLGDLLYGDKWDETRAHNTKRITNGATEDSTQLTEEQLNTLIEGMNKLKAKRTNGAAVGR